MTKEEFIAKQTSLRNQVYRDDVITLIEATIQWLAENAASKEAEK